MADSLKLAVASALVCVLAWSGWLERLGGEAASTAAFLLHFSWPGLALVLTLLVGFFALRDARARRQLQALAAIVVSLAVLGFSWTQFKAWG